jgi:ubiquinone/menaquinone biosynthesis C-methylase UbiE
VTRYTRDSTPNIGANPEQIADYYNANTGKFLRFGGAEQIGAIHRAIWASGVNTQAHALSFLNHLVAKSITPLIRGDAIETQVLDLGCGVGGTAVFLAKELGVSITGITISETQTQIARQRAKSTSVSDKTNFITADFETLSEMANLDAIYAIESLVHARDLKAILERAAKMLRTNGRFILCDDFLSPDVSPMGQVWVERFKRGWQLNSLVTIEELETIAENAGLRLVESHNLTAFLRGFPAPILNVMSQITRIPVPWAYWRNLAGGTALQVCVKRGWTRYQAFVWEKC